MQKKIQLSHSLILGLAGTPLLLAPLYANYFGSLATLLTLLAILVGVVLVRRYYSELKIGYENQAAESNRQIDDLSIKLSQNNSMEQSIRWSERQHRDAFEFAPTGIALISPSKQFLRVNRALADMFGCSQKYLADTGLFSLVVPEEVDSVQVSFGKLLDGSARHCSTEVHISIRGEAALCVRMKAALVRDPSNDPAYFIAEFEDITDRRKAEDFALHNLLHDVTTDLPNRFLFLDRLQVAVKRLQRNPETSLSVLHVDFDRFKSVNDRFGLRTADELLVEASRRLRILMRANSTVARLGADEFAVLLEHGSFDEVLAVVAKIQKELSMPYDINGEQIYSTVSIGVAVGTEKHESPEHLLRDAGTALMHAKTLGRDRYEIFSDDMHQRAIHSLDLESELRHATARGEIKVLYQPIITLETGILAGFEALVRWEHPARGLISPVEFIPIAEKSGLILEIGEWVLRESCRQLRCWQKASERSAGLWMSVNVSSRQFTESDLVSIVSDVLNVTGLDPRFLKLEITESMMVENMDFVSSVMQDLKDTGVRLSIDDFGTGFSSLSMLDQLPLSSLKIDRSFVSQIKDSEVIVETVRTIVNLAHSLNLEIIAEGVESIDQLSQLRHLGCQFGQGYCFATPLEAATVDELIGGLPSTSPLFYLLPTAAEIPAPVSLT